MSGCDVDRAIQRLANMNSKLDIGGQKEAACKNGGPQNPQVGKENQEVSAATETEEGKFVSIQQVEHQVQQQHERFCFECHRSLSKSRHIINISGKSHRWHSECFRCHMCGHLLEREASCHIFRDQIVCKDDYARLQQDHNQSLVKCTRCTWPINSTDWVRRAANHVYHLACFSCDICLRLLSTGEQFAVQVQDSDGSVKLLCRLHFAIDAPPVNQIASTNSPLNLQPHSSHSLPAQAPLPHLHQLPHPASIGAQRSTTSGFSSHRSSNTVNTIENGGKAFSPEGSQQPEQASMYLHANQQHHHQRQQLSRHSNSPSCGTQNYDSFVRLHGNEQQQEQQSSRSIGEVSGTSSLQGQQQHYMRCFLRNESVGLASSAGPQVGSVQPMHLCRSNKATTGLLQIATPNTDEINHRTSTASSSSSVGSTTSGQLLTPTGTANSKSKRVRTTFTEDQLSILQTHFQIDSNPDGQDLERIATITGLSKRVTQVWFQNSRARQKKYMIKRKPVSSATHLTLPTNLQQYSSETCRHSSGQDTVTGGAERSSQQASAWSSQLSDRSDEISLDTAGLSAALIHETGDSQQSSPDDQLALSDTSN